MDLHLLKRLARSEVIRHLETGHQEKDLIIEPSLMKPLERVIEVTSLKERGVCKIYALDNTISSQSHNVVYIVSPDVISVKCIISHIKIDILSSFSRNRWVLFYPSRSIVTDYLLETEGVMGDVNVDELTLNFIPLESEVLSMEYPLAFRQLYVDQTNVPLFSIARALFNFECLFGKIPKIYTIGTYSLKLIELFKLSMLQHLPTSSEVPIEIGKLVIIDRNVDPVTVCSSQLTFEGLLADVYSIKSGFIKPADFPTKILLTDQDKTFGQIRNLPLDKVAVILRTLASDIQARQTKLKDCSIKEMQDFITREFRKLTTEKKNLDTYLNLCDRVIKDKQSHNFNLRVDIENSLRSCDFSDDLIKYIEWQVISQRDILSTLKLLCLWNCTKFSYSFLVSDNLNKIKKNFIELFLQSYGYEHLSTFYNLQKTRFFTNYNSDDKGSYKYLLEEFELNPENKDLMEKEDISNVFGGKYRPFSSTLIEKIINENFPKVDCSKFFESGIQSTILSPAEKISENAENTVAVLYLGGVCHSEISCLRILSKKYNKRIILLTTSVLNGSDIMEMHIDSPMI